MADHKYISVRGAREHNLKNIYLDLPRDSLIVFTGLSGSGKSSLAFDTIYAEGQRRYVESLSAYARQFLEMMQKPDVDQIDGLSPAISIEQKTTSRNPRSTVGTVTEIYDYMRLLFARIGVAYSPATGLADREPDRHADGRPRDGAARGHAALSARADRARPQGRIPQGARRAAEEGLPASQGRRQLLRDRRRVRRSTRSSSTISMWWSTASSSGTISATVWPTASRPRSSSPTAWSSPNLPTSPCRLHAHSEKSANKSKNETHERILFSEKFACPVSGFTIAEIEPRLFSFNNPFGACPKCDGLGTELAFEPDLVVPDPTLSLREGAILPWAKTGNPRPITPRQSKRWPSTTVLDLGALEGPARRGARCGALRHRRGRSYLRL